MYHEKRASGFGTISYVFFIAHTYEHGTLVMVYYGENKFFNLYLIFFLYRFYRMHHLFFFEFDDGSE